MARTSYFLIKNRIRSRVATISSASSSESFPLEPGKKSSRTFERHTFLAEGRRDRTTVLLFSEGTLRVAISRSVNSPTRRETVLFGQPSREQTS